MPIYNLYFGNAGLDQSLVFRLMEAENNPELINN